MTYPEAIIVKGLSKTAVIKETSTASLGSQTSDTKENTAVASRGGITEYKAERVKAFEKKKKRKIDACYNWYKSYELGHIVNEMRFLF